MSMTGMMTRVSALVFGAAVATWAIAGQTTTVAVAQAPAAGAPAAPAPAGDASARVTRGQLVMEGIPEIPAEINESLLRYQNARAAGFLGWTPDGGMLISTRFGETSQIHRVDAPLGMRRQLTFYAEPVGSASYPLGADPGGFVYAKDTGGDENFQVWFQNDETGAVTRVSAEGTRNTGAVWSDDGRRLAWTVSSQKDAIYRIFVADVANPDGRRQVFEREGAWNVVDWSPDGSKLLIDQGVSIAESYLWILDIASGELVQINKKDQKIAYGQSEFAPDGASIYFTSDEGREFQTLVRYDIASGQQTPISGNIDWDVEGFDVSRDGSLVAFSVNENGASRVYIRRAADGSDAPAPQLPAGELGGLQFSADGTKLGFGIATASSAGDAWSFDLTTQQLTRWTESEIGGLDPAAFVEPVIGTYPSFDGKQIPFFYYLPKNKGPGPFPVVVTIHGGPEAQERPSFAPIWQFWLNELGIAVVVPNVRGSTGYGKSFVELDNGFKRKDSVKDIGALLDWIATQPDKFDAGRVMVYGGSYGGYMVNAAMVDYADRLAGGVSIVAISSFVTFLENTSGYRQDLRRVEYGDERDPEMRKFQEEIAPLAHASKITKPIFIIHGANDPRVPVSEAEQLFAAVKANGQNPWWLVAMDEGHGFRKKSNRDFMNAAVAMFFKERLLGQKPGG